MNKLSDYFPIVLQLEFPFFYFLICRVSVFLLFFLFRIFCSIALLFYFSLSLPQSFYISVTLPLFLNLFFHSNCPLFPFLYLKKISVKYILMFTYSPTPEKHDSVPWNHQKWLPCQILQCRSNLFLSAALHCHCQQ